MNINDELILNIEKLSSQGFGISKVDGFVVFVQGACPGDELKAKITKLNKHYAYAEILEIITPSESRVEPFCPMQKVCGACQIHFIDYDRQLDLKSEMVKDAFRNIAGFDLDIPKTVASPENKCYRHKIQYPVSQTKVSKRILAGYYKQQSHEIVNIKYCPIQPSVCDKIVEFIREKAHEYSISGYDEKKHRGDLKHIVLRVSDYSSKVLVTLVVNSKEVFSRYKNLASAIYNEFEQVSGVCLNLNPMQTNVILTNKTVCICGVDFVEEKILDKVFKIGSNTFFQVNPKSAANIFSYVKKEIEKFETPSVLDAYAGIAAFGIVVSDAAGGVVSVEENKDSIKMAEEALKINNIKNVELYAQDTAKYLSSVKRKFDITILDPPRKGCSQLSLDLALEHTKKEIIYVSCNPATLARDIKILCQKGCTLKSVQPFDMFCHTYHVETVAILAV